MASSSSVSNFDNHRFKTAFNEELYNTIVKNKKVIAECCIDLDEDEYPKIREQIALRGWRRLATPKQEVSIDLIHEYYANAVVTEEEMEEAGGHTFRSFVRGVPVDFSPGNIQTVMRFRTQVQGATTDFETKKEHDQQLDRVLADLCMPGATWKLSTGQLRVSIQLRRQELNPVARGWHDFSIHSLIPSSNRSEIPVIRAILIHCIMRGEDVRAEDIIADKIVRMAQGIKEKGKLGFPSTIYKLCKEAGVPLREFRRTKKIQAEKPITARRMESTRLPRPVQRRQQEDEEEDEPMPKAGEVNEQLKDWTRNASARESYAVWAHQQANPNLVEMPSQKIVKQIYDNIDYKRPMFRGLLKSDLQPSNPALPPSSSKDPKDPPSIIKRSKGSS
ncbi:hypothetical protein PIB30_072825 [Stylosanthes scabra]|uniref:Putative plant transposon protein domain-containing protein n=1 Tax=Stylosanthes scabra TaxID=79078 RepID=A0ABU6VP70_9FABA|nr:hypothetical protein [Stylosanthes scabra]